MYGQFFNIDESAFSIAPNPKYLFLSKQHEEALAHLIYGVTRKGGFVCLTGDIGTGKTTVCRCMFEQLPDKTDIAFVINPKFSPMELLASICDELHLDYSAFQPSIKEYVKKLYTYLIEAHAQGRNTVLVIDEAHNLSIDALEHVRTLTNLETNEQKLLQIILIGQPELKTLLAKPELEQVSQRITARYHIGPLSLRETGQYINHRLLVAGAKQKIFSPSNIKHIYKITRGVPRLINILCDRILLGACTMKTSNISPKIVKQSDDEVFDSASAYNGLFLKTLTASVFALLISGAVLFAYLNTKFDTRTLLNSLFPQSEENIALTPSSEEAMKQNVVVNKQAISAEKTFFEKHMALEKEKVVQIAKVEQKRRNQEGVNEKPASFATDNENVKDVAEKIENKTNKALVSEESVSIEDVKKDSGSTNNNSKDEIKFSSYRKAYQHLFRLWGVDYSSTDLSPCEHAINNQLHCYHGRGSINKIISLNRPVLLKSTEERFGPSYIVVASIEGDHAIVNENDVYKLVAISEIETNWIGEFEMLWRPLQTGVSHIKPGQEGEVVALLDQKLAKFQGREPSSSHPFVYSEELVNQVRAFQEAHKLPSNGVVGPITQMHINNIESPETPYLTKERYSNVIYSGIH